MRNIYREMDKLYVLTYRRAKQFTWDRLPNSWKDRTVLVCDEEDAEMHRKAGRSVLVSPAQGKGLYVVKEWVYRHALAEGVKKYGMLDDDVTSFAYTCRSWERDKFPCINNELSPEQYDEMFGLASEWLDEVVTCGLDVRWSPQIVDEPYFTSHRQSAIHFFNGETLPRDLDWLGVPKAEDFYLILQLLTRGYPNRVSARHRIIPAATQEHAGGETLTRTLQSHNESMVLLRDAFPSFVDLYYKKQKAGEWGGTDKLAARIAWKKAFKSSKEEKTVSVVDLFGE